VIFEFKDIIKKFSDFELNVDSFILNSGKISGLIGKNGAGKTTLLKIISGLYYCQTLSIKLDNDIIKCDSKDWKKHIMFVPETNVLPDSFTRKDLNIFYSHFYSNWKTNTFLTFLKTLDVPDKNVKQLSLGNKKKLALAAAFSSGADLLILDEPISNIDPIERENIMKIMKDYAKSGKVIVYSSHILSEIKLISDNLIALNKGKCVLNCCNDEKISEESLLELIR
jgi:ABC-2 type transport system ATP-binding protein